MISLSKLFSQRTPSLKKTNALTSGNLKFIRSPRKMISALQECLDKGAVVGIYSRVLGEGMFLTGVENIYLDDDEKVVVLKRYDLGGNILARTHFSIHEFDSICLLGMAYTNPFMEAV